MANRRYYWTKAAFCARLFVVVIKHLMRKPPGVKLSV